MMINERKQVLQLLADGKVTAEDAEKLLDKLNSSQATPSSDVSPQPASVSQPKFMCVHVDSCEGDVVDIKLPIGLLRSGIKLSAMMPKEAAEAMTKNGVDFSQLSQLGGSDFMAALSAMRIDVTSKEGDTVRICCE